MKILPKQYAQSLFELVRDKDEQEVKDILKKFTNILARNLQLGKIKEIIACFEIIWQRENGELLVNLQSARPLVGGAKDIVVDYLKDKTKAASIILEEEIDQSLIGGFILRYDNRIIDTSIKSQLNTLRTKLIK
jgi:F-type H+-transporting ATPase subunit delta